MERGLKRALSVVATVVALGLIALAAWLWWSGKSSPQETAPPVAAASVPAASAAASATEPAIRYPVELPAEPATSTAPDVDTLLAELFGSKALRSMFQTKDFARRFVATVDNLGRADAPAGLWPVNPTGGRFTVEKRDGAEVISADNGLRYTPFVLLIEGLDLRQAVSVYARLYPMFQQSYQDLGYPGRYFNDRLVEVIDQLLATPDAPEALAVQLPVINGPVQPERPWVLYEFTQPELQALTAGQKLLLRMGPVNERRMKGRLEQARKLLTARGSPR